MFTATVYNYFGHGNTWKFYGAGNWSRNILSFRLGRYRVRIVQHRDILANRLTPGDRVVTSQFEIDSVKRFSEGVSITNDICRLLSFAAMSQVVPYEYRMGSTKKRTGAVGQSWHFRPVIDIKDGNLTASYLEKVWCCYRREKRRRKLAEVIDMLTIADLPTQPLEIKLTIIFIVLENLKSTYARTQGLPFVKGYFRRVSTTPKTDPSKEKKWSFEALLTKMFSEATMRPRLSRVIHLRNEILHFGLSRKPFRSLIKHNDSCQDIVREYLLRLLGYDGHYLIYSTGSNASRLLR